MERNGKGGSNGKTAQTKNTIENDGVRYSIKQSFEKQIDAWDKKTVGFSFVLGTTSKSLLMAGLPDKQIRWDATKLKRTLLDHKNMSLAIIKKIPQLLENPIVVINSKSDNNSRIVMGDLYDDAGKIVTVVLKLNPSSRKGNELDLIKVSSSQGRSHIESLFKYESGKLVAVRFVDKNRIQDWLNANRLQLPLHSFNLDSTKTISQPDDSVNTQDDGLRLSEKDTDYLAAVNRGDMETAQRMVDKAAKAAGYNYHLYHGTNADFTKFDLRKFGGRNGKGEGYGIYLAANRVISAPYGKNIIDAYVKFNRLAEGTKKTLSLSEVKKLVKKACEVEAQKTVADGEYESIAEALKDTWVSNYVYTYDYSSMAQVYSDVAYMIWENNDNDGDIINEMMASSGAHYDYNNALNFYENVLTPVTNIDGFHYIWGNKDGSGEQNDIYLAFSSNQIKSADPVTYDDNGNVIPLSERFNENENDIRYSEKGSDIDPLEVLRKQYGTIKPGESPFRVNVEIPKKTESHKKVSQMIRIVAEAEATPDVAMPTIVVILTLPLDIISNMQYD